MKKIILTLTFLLITIQSFAQVFVHGYEREDGTQVVPYYRTYPDQDKSNNWSYPGNFNPYTSNEGNKNYNDTYKLPHNEFNLNSGAEKAGEL